MENHHQKQRLLENKDHRNNEPKKKRKRRNKHTVNNQPYVLQPINNFQYFSPQDKGPIYYRAPDSDIKLRNNLLSIYDTTAHLLEHQAHAVAPQQLYFRTS